MVHVTIGFFTVEQQVKCLKPKSFWAHVWHSGFHWDVTLSASAALSSFVVAGKLYVDRAYVFAAIGLAGCLLSVASGVGRAIGGVMREVREHTPDEMDGLLVVLNAILTRSPIVSMQDPDLRLCIFVPHPKKRDTVIQLTDYVGPIPRYGRNREMSLRSGIVGLAFRFGEAHFDRVSEGTALIDYLMATYGFDRKEAADMQPDRRSYAAIPIGRPGKVIAVLFLDSRDHKFFGRSDSQRRKVLEGAIAGIAELIDLS